MVEVPGYPRYKSNSRYHSFTYPQSGYEIDCCSTRKKAARKTTSTPASEALQIGHIKMVMHRPIEGTIKTCSIKRDGDPVVCSLRVEYTFNPAMAFHKSTEEVGLTSPQEYAYLSKRCQYRQVPVFYRAPRSRSTAHKKLSRRTRGSHRRQPARKKKTRTFRGRLYRKTRHRRQDFLHKTSRRCLVQLLCTLVFEDLQIKNMSATPKPKKDEETGKFVPNGGAAKVAQ